MDILVKLLDKCFVCLVAEELVVALDNQVHLFKTISVAYDVIFNLLHERLYLNERLRDFFLGCKLRHLEINFVTILMCKKGSHLS